ncbi:hypothetical protein I7I51_08648 [Histoplasma capsulatum]|uniref:Uncharacterized protein n=1 Tax=Ajellomyces capsulatus TaxID=5037 RepID=A0A8A1M0X4_AJECA|nr:hypothetical protein I7I51_08648 [Histoplasma capsulatum]
MTAHNTIWTTRRAYPSEERQLLVADYNAIVLKERSLALDERILASTLEQFSPSRSLVRSFEEFFCRDSGCLFCSIFIEAISTTIYIRHLKIGGSNTENLLSIRSGIEDRAHLGNLQRTGEG